MATRKARRVVGYVRISRDRANETSTESQRKAIEAWCTAHGHQLVKVVTEPGRSAFKSSRKSRPGFREAAKLIGSGAGDLLAVWKVDRACRNTLDLLTLVQDLERQGAEFASVTEQFDTSTPMGRAMLTIVGVLAELESAQKSERATEWHRSRRQSGAVPAGPAALGYRKPAPNTLEPDPDTAPLVREAAERVANGGSLHGTAKWLCEQGVSVTHVGLRTTLVSPTLAGLVAMSDQRLPRQGGRRVLTDADLVPGGWEPIIDRETWDRVREVIEDPERQRSAHWNRLKHALGPVARCHCGSAMSVRHDHYKVKNGTHRLRRLKCDECGAGIAYDGVEEAVTAAVLDLLDDEAWNRIRVAQPRGSEADLDAAAEVEAKLVRMWEMVLDGKLDPEEYAEAKTRWAGEVAVSSAPAAELPDVDDLRAAWADFTADEKLLVYRAAIRRLVIGPATRRGGRGVDLSRVDLELVS